MGDVGDMCLRREGIGEMREERERGTDDWREYKGKGEIVRTGGTAERQRRRGREAPRGCAQCLALCPLCSLLHPPSCSVLRCSSCCCTVLRYCGIVVLRYCDTVVLCPCPTHPPIQSTVNVQRRRGFEGPACTHASSWRASCPHTRVNNQHPARVDFHRSSH